MTVWYLDASAIVKLAFAEAETKELRRWLRSVGGDTLATSALSIAEVMRAADRAGADADHALEVVDAMDHLEVDRTLLVEAGRIARPELRTLDAIHLASAMTFGAELGALLTYDRGMAAAARGLSLLVHAPGVP